MTKFGIVTIFLVMTVLWDSASFCQPLYAESETGGYSEQHAITQEDIEQKNECDKSEIINKSELYCNATFDQFLCWGYAKAGTTVTQNCPPDLPFVDSSSLHKIYKNIKKGKEAYKEYATRRCGLDGYWLDRYNKSDKIGWTDFIKCFPPHMQELMENISTSPDAFSSKFAVAAWIRRVEIFGLTTSSIFLIISLWIFYYYPQLLNNRTRIHRHLFSVLLLQAIVTLIIYIDQEAFQLFLLYNTPCVLFYILYEFLTSVTFTFTLIEGITLFRMVSANALRPQLPYKVIIMAGYLLPTCNLIVWVAVASYKYGWTQSSRCWYGYNLDTIYWILQGPRLVIISTNVLLMSLVIGTLIQKLINNDRSSEFCKLKIAVRAAIILMPLLGITNFISMTNAPLKDSTTDFAVWGFFAYFLRSMQGCFVALIYCLRNTEVMELLKRERAKKQKNMDRHSRFRPNNTDCEVDRRDDEESRMGPPECQPDLKGSDLNQSPNDAELKEECTAIELTEVVVHRTDDQDTDHDP